MNTQQLIGWMEDPASLGKEDSAQLETLTQTFPYFQTAHLLLIKSLHNQNSFLYNNQLKVTAAYATNRRVLYELITKGAKDKAHEAKDKGQEKEVKKTDELIVPVEEKEETQNEVAVADVKTLKPDLPEKIIQPEFPKKHFVSNPDEWEAGMLRQLQLLHHWKTTGPVTPVKDEKTLPGKEKNATPETKQPEEKIIPEEEQSPTAADEINTLLYVLVEPEGAENISTPEEPLQQKEEEETTEWEVIPVADEKETEVTPVDLPEDPVQQEIIREAISSSIELEVDDALPKPEELMPKKGQGAEDKAHGTNEKEKGAWSKGQGTWEVRQAETGKEKAKEEKRLQATPWVKKTPPETPSEPEKEAGELTFSGWLKSLDKEKTEVPPAGKTAIPEKQTHEDQIISKFIEDSPRIRPQKNQFYSPVNMAKKSVQESDEFITETLARIYVKQGNISKAVRAYQKLSLKFPEKTAYFAALIEELKRNPK